MKFAYGKTRWVILTKTKAVKIARVRILEPWFILFRSLFRRKFTDSVKKHGSSTLTALISGGLPFLTLGISSNIREWRLWETNPSPFLVPTLYSFFGLINIQERGEKVTAEDMRTGHPFIGMLRDESEETRYDLTKPENFSKIDGQIQVHDYGSWPAVNFFLKCENMYNRIEGSFARPF